MNLHCKLKKLYKNNLPQYEKNCKVTYIRQSMLQVLDHPKNNRTPCIPECKSDGRRLQSHPEPGQLRQHCIGRYSLFLRLHARSNFEARCPLDSKDAQDYSLNMTLPCLGLGSE